jgi:hypothetical protein
MGIPEAVFLSDSGQHILQTQSSRFQIRSFIPDSEFSLDTWKVIWNDIETKDEGSRVSNLATNGEEPVLC